MNYPTIENVNIEVSLQEIYPIAVAAKIFIENHRKELDEKFLTKFQNEYNKNWWNRICRNKLFYMQDTAEYITLCYKNDPSAATRKFYPNYPCNKFRIHYDIALEIIKSSQTLINSSNKITMSLHNFNNLVTIANAK